MARLPNRSGPEVAAGALVWRLVGGQLQVLLIHRPRYNDWSWPKGKLEPGEEALTCAWREVLEETGRQVVLGRPLPSVSYPLKTGRQKLVHYWAARLATDRDNPAICARPDVAVASPREVDRTEWLPAHRAMRRLTRPTDRIPLVKLMERHQRERLNTRAVVVVRHAEATPRSRWPKPESSRPLTERGVGQASGLVTMLAALGIRQVLSSPWARCTATVRPFTRQARVRLGTSRWLTEDDAVLRPDRAERIMRRVLQGHTPMAVCSHRPVLPALLAAVRSVANRKVATDLLGVALVPGEMMVAHVAVAGPKRGRVIAIERHRPPQRG
jgi:8-oxo-dGTP diphosphatase